MIQRTERYTFEDWLSWDEDVRAELVDGLLYTMAPPLRIHQEIIGEIFRQIANFLKGKPCKVFPAPFGVRLSESEDTAFEPDIVVVCDPSKLDDRICNGAPDMVVEVLSPSTVRMDMMVKFNKYKNAGVREYWIVDPERNVVLACTLRDGFYVMAAYGDSDVAPVGVLPGCEILLREVFVE